MSYLSQCIIKVWHSFLQNIEVKSLTALKERLYLTRIILNQIGWKKIQVLQPPCCRHRHVLINNKINIPLGRLSCKCSPWRFLMPIPSANSLRQWPHQQTTSACPGPHIFERTSSKEGPIKITVTVKRTLSQAWPENYLQFLYCLLCLKIGHFILKRAKQDG